MGLGVKRICAACHAKFYDLEKDPIICPKCGAVYDPEGSDKSKKPEQKQEEPEEKVTDLELDLNDEDLDEALLEDDDSGVDLDEDMRDKLEIKEDEEIVREKAGGAPDVLSEISGDTDDIIETGGDEEEHD